MRPTGNTTELREHDKNTRGSATALQFLETQPKIRKSNRNKLEVADIAGYRIDSLNAYIEPLATQLAA
ncbi:unnamed protein product [Lota lota]